MQTQLLDHWITSLLPIYSIRKISTITSISRNRIRSLRDARLSETRFLHIRERLATAIPEIKQAIVEFTLRNPTFSHLQVAQLISERSGTVIARTTINRLKLVGKPCHAPIDVDFGTINPLFQLKTVTLEGRFTENNEEKEIVTEAFTHHPLI
jgi:hypothetical protein